MKEARRWTAVALDSDDHHSLVVLSAQPDVKVCSLVCQGASADTTHRIVNLIAAAPDLVAGVEQMLAFEYEGGEGWWKGWEMLRAARRRAISS